MNSVTKIILLYSPGMENIALLSDHLEWIWNPLLGYCGSALAFSSMIIEQMMNLNFIIFNSFKCLILTLSVHVSRIIYVFFFFFFWEFQRTCLDVLSFRSFIGDHLSWGPRHPIYFYTTYFLLFIYLSNIKYIHIGNPVLKAFIPKYKRIWSTRSLSMFSKRFIMDEYWMNNSQKRLIITPQILCG